MQKAFDQGLPQDKHLSNPEPGCDLLSMCAAEQHD